MNLASGKALKVSLLYDTDYIGFDRLLQERAFTEQASTRKIQTKVIC
jgi:hypothetical protein